MSEEFDEIKSSRLSTLAMLVEVLIECKGIQSTKELAEYTGRHERQIWKAKAELKAIDASLNPAKYGSATEDTLPNMAVPNKAEQLPNMVTGTEVAISRAPKESSYEDTPPKIDINPPLSPFTDENRAVFKNGKISLRDDLKAFWLEEFKTDDELNLALTQAAAFIQPNTSKPMEALVSAQLARMARIKRETDRRYASACEKKTNGKTTEQFMDEIRAASRQLELENGSALQ